MKVIAQKLVSNKWFEKLVLAVIGLNIVLIIAMTDKGIYSDFQVVFKRLEFSVIIFFSCEYLLRVMSVNDVKDIFKPMLLIDFFATFPFYLSFFPINTTFLRAIRLVKIFQILKVTRYSLVLQTFFNVFRNKKDELIMIFFLLMIAVVIAASVMYLAEGQVQVKFSSIPKAMWWAIVTFTSVGYGDVYPITDIGKFVASIVAVLGVGLHGILIAVLGAGFIEQIPSISAKKTKHIAAESMIEKDSGVA
jgi:voltage-gated potassium channel